MVEETRLRTVSGFPVYISPKIYVVVYNKGIICDIIVYKVLKTGRNWASNSLYS